MKNQKISLSIIFPAYNEEKNIAASINRAQAYSNKRGIDCEIIVVNDGSRDNTVKVIKEEISRDSRVKLLQHKVNQGYGCTVYDGLKSAKKDIIFFMDSDLQFDINELDGFLKKIDKYDVVIGYRNPRRDHFMRLVNAWGWKYLIFIVFGIKVRDIDCAFKLFKKQALDEISVKSRGAMFSPELIIRLVAKRKRIAQLPVSHYKRIAGSQSGAKLSVIWLAFKELYANRSELKRELAQIDKCDRIIS